MTKRGNPTSRFAPGQRDAEALVSPAAQHSANDSDLPEPIDPVHREAVRRGLEQSRRRDYASEAEVEASFALFDP